jgi:hypothetical protein
MPTAGYTDDRVRFDTGDECSEITLTEFCQFAGVTCAPRLYRSGMQLQEPPPV